SICNPHILSKNLHDKFADVRPLICIVCIPTPQRENGHQDMFTKPKCVLKFFSLKTHQIVKTLDFDNDSNIVGVSCNERAIVVSLTNPSRLHIFSPLTLAPLFLSPLQDVAIHPSTRSPVFALGPRLLAYSTTSHPPEMDAKMDDYAMDESNGAAGTTGKYHEVAKGVAKEVVNGVKLLGDYGYQTFSSYFANTNSQTTVPVNSQTTMPINIKNRTGSISPASRGSFSPQDSPSNGHYYNLKGGGVNSGSGESANMVGLNGNINSYENDKENGAVGAVIIRDLGTLGGVQKKQPSIIAHFSPHTHPVGYLSFNPSGSFLFSTSVQGHQFHVIEIIGKHRQRKSNKNLKHVYQLSRGYTNASVSDGGVGWSGDSRWCAVSSGRGTIHVFAINPYGGPAHVPSHITGWVNNVDKLYKSTTQSPVVRIKPRTPLPQDSSDVNGTSQGSNIYVNRPHEHYPLSSTDANATSIDQSRRQSQLHYQGNLNNNFYSQYNGQSHPAFHYLRRSQGICVKFLPSMSNNSKSELNANNGLLVANLHAKRQAKRRSSPNVVTEGITSNGTSMGRTSRRRTQSWSQNTINNFSHSDYLGVETRDNKLDDIGYQDLLSFHPSGILTLHRLWMEKAVVEETSGQGTKDETNNNNLITLAGTQLSGSAATVANVGRALVGGAAGVVGIGMGIAGAVKKELTNLDMVTNYEDIAEWQLIRNSSWTEVKNIIEAPKKCTESEISIKRDGKKWLANAEIATHTNSKISLPPPLWATPQFSFQTFLPGYKDAINKGEVPRSKKIEIRRDIVESVELVNDEFGVKGWINEKKYNRNSGKINKAILVPAGKAIGKGVGDISVNLSTAMKTSLDFTPSSPTLSAFSTKSKDPRISNGLYNGLTQQIASDTSITPLSFEDAYHIHIGNNISSITASSTSSPKLKNNPLGFSPLSSNMMANDTTFEQRSPPFTRSFSSSSIASDITYNDEVDEYVKRLGGMDESNEGGNFFFSPDGDNEVDLPSDSVIEP
ncbi:6162_t:CDS:2, partial [Scutellospora calospora]